MPKIIKSETEYTTFLNESRTIYADANSRVNRLCISALWLAAAKGDVRPLNGLEFLKQNDKDALRFYVGEISKQVGNGNKPLEDGLTAETVKLYGQAGRLLTNRTKPSDDGKKPAGYAIAAKGGHTSDVAKAWVKWLEDNADTFDIFETSILQSVKAMGNYELLGRAASLAKMFEGDNAEKLVDVNDKVKAFLQRFAHDAAEMQKGFEKTKQPALKPRIIEHDAKEKPTKAPKAPKAPKKVKATAPALVDAAA